MTNAIVCTKIQADSGPYEDLLITVKKNRRSYDGSDTDQIKWPLQKVLQGTAPGKRKKEGKITDEKTTSKIGPVSTSTAVREQAKTVRDGRRSSPMSAVVPLYDPDGSGVTVCACIRFACVIRSG